MKYVIFAFYDKVMESFGLPRTSNLNVENFIQDFRRAIIKGFEIEKCNQFISQAIYELGSYDDESGVIVPCPAKLLLDCDEALLVRQQIEAEKKKKEIKSDE